MTILLLGCDNTLSVFQYENQIVKNYTLDANANGILEKVDNIKNISIVSKDPNVFTAEYKAGFVQGKLQGEDVIAARDNTWDMMYLLDPSHSYPQNIPPSAAEFKEAEDILIENYTYTMEFINNLDDAEKQENLKRLLFRMLGIYHGLALDSPADLDFSGQWVPNLDYFSSEELKLGYETEEMSWLDIYFINSFMDLGDYIDFSKEFIENSNLTKCSAFVKKVDDEILIAHNSWYGYLSQTMTVNLVINEDILIVNAIIPGIIASNTDFGYNNKGIMFNETTHRAAYSEPKNKALWSFWRAAAAEQFASSIDEFFEYISMDISGTYMNGYMVVDAKTNEIGLVEISHKSFVFYHPTKDGYRITTKPEGLSTEYDKDLVKPDYLLGINYPASKQISDDLQSVDNRPARKKQFMEKIDGVIDIETAKDLITYTDPKNPLSLYGRWDLGYGETPSPKTIPDGSIDAKVASSNDALRAMKLKGELDTQSENKGFWMRYGTPHVNDSPFIWSESEWSSQKLRDVPDRVDGSFNLMNIYIK